MDSVPSRNVVLLSIRPQFVERILSGEKAVEFRRTGLPETVASVVVYCTAPVQRVVAYFSVSGVVTAPPDKLWRQFRGVAGIEREAFFEYYKGCEKGRAIQIAEVTRLSQPVDLAKISRGMKAPQSLRYLDATEFDRVRRHAA
ncbi:hypothetical protein [Botrimarina mediterranea]|uniref:ASCH domain-containing protein n=1 Tax=Botrimarina mediterranea TaxID=2528022 RepID=A0A518K627_9BACT|nr:hypothetical protein [Botrimarina mediterranea]QDV73241.1 50S ribosomal protein L22/unknown domain fusion protein [Botrimarina mediterranea]